MRLRAVLTQASFGIVSNLTKAAETGKASTRLVLNDLANQVLSVSQRNVPVDTGNLKSSGRIEYATDRRLEARITYGGSMAPYALPVHELHKSKSKYLANAADLVIREAPKAVAESVTATL